MLREAASTAARDFAAAEARIHGMLNAMRQASSEEMDQVADRFNELGFDLVTAADGFTLECVDSLCERDVGDLGHCSEYSESLYHGESPLSLLCSCQPMMLTSC